MGLRFLVDPEKSPLVPLLEALHNTFGSCFEGVLHDLSNPDRSLVYIVGTVTGREPGAPITDLVLKVLRAHGDAAPDLIGYETRTHEGKRLKATTVFLRHPSSGKIIGCVCLNLDLTSFDLAAHALSEFTVVKPLSVSASDTFQDGRPETFPRSVTEVLLQVANEGLAKMGKPVPATTKDDKLRFIKYLDERGVFSIRGAVNYVGKVLNISRYTVYGYLQEVRTPNRDTFV